MHIHLQAKETAGCPKCGKPVLSHTVCENCGLYRGKEAKDVLAKLTKREQKAKEKELASQQEGSPRGSQGELNAEELSRPTQ